MMMKNTKKGIRNTITRSYKLEKASCPATMEYQLTGPDDQEQLHWRGYVSKKSPNKGVEFPSSPQLIFGEEIVHFSHPQHTLSMVDIPDMFSCVGCKEYGSGKRFVCQQCDFQLHDFCALAPPALKAHPFHSQHPMLFHSKPAKTGMTGKSKCDVCGKLIKGFGFVCRACAFQMHPCCAMMSTEMEYPSHPHTLRVLPTPMSDTGNTIVCGECKRRRSGKVYRCTVCEYHLHAMCAKSKINGLQANGIKTPEKPSVLAAAARVASQVVIEFIGGLVEGIGESVGDVLVQNIAKGNNASSPPPPRTHTPRYK